MQMTWEGRNSAGLGLSMLGRGEMAPAGSEFRLCFYLERGRGVGWGQCCFLQGWGAGVCCMLSQQGFIQPGLRGGGWIFWHLLSAEEPRL